MRVPLAILLFVLSWSVSAQDVPELTGRVIDHAEILTDATELSITSLLSAHEEATSNQVAVLTIPQLEGESIESYANLVFREWGLGRADVNNGVLLLVARDDRELRIEVGYGLEGDLTDAEAGRIIRNVIVPQFRSNDFDGGVLAGVNAILGTIEGSYEPPADSGEDEGLPIWMALIFLFTHGLMPMFMAVRSLVNPFFARYFTLLFSLIFVGVMALMIGGALFGETGFAVSIVLIALYVLAYIAADIYMSNSPKWQEIRKQVREAQKSGKKTTIDAGWINFSAGGSSSSGGFGGGGFSGGGGSSGGGGASGSW